jgi:hypothetical protein
VYFIDKPAEEPLPSTVQPPGRPPLDPPPVVYQQPHLTLDAQKVILTRLGYINDYDNQKMDVAVRQFLRDLELFNPAKEREVDYVPLLFLADQIVQSVSADGIPTLCVRPSSSSLKEIGNRLFDMCVSAKDRYHVQFFRIQHHKEILSRLREIERTCAFTLNDNFESEKTKVKFINTESVLKGMFGQQLEACTHFNNMYGPGVELRNP